MDKKLADLDPHCFFFLKKKQDMASFSMVKVGLNAFINVWIKHQFTPFINISIL